MELILEPVYIYSDFIEYPGIFEKYLLPVIIGVLSSLAATYLHTCLSKKLTHLLIRESKLDSFVDYVFAIYVYNTKNMNLNTDEPHFYECKVRNRVSYALQFCGQNREDYLSNYNSDGREYRLRYGIFLNYIDNTPKYKVLKFLGIHEKVLDKAIKFAKRREREMSPYAGAIRMYREDIIA